MAPTAGRRPAWLLLVGILLVAANLRALLTSVGPVVPLIAEDGLSPILIGLLMAIPVAAFAVVSPVVHPLAARWGLEKTVLLALLLLLVGGIARSWGGVGAHLWAGTLVIGAAITVGNVLLPVATKSDFPRHIPSVTGGYMAVQSIVAGVAAGVSVPIAAVTDSWEMALVVWCVLVPLALLAWLPRLWGSPVGDTRATTLAAQATAPAPATVKIWRSLAAWQVAVYFLLQSTAFYVLVNWLPTVEQGMGISAEAAGWHLALFMIVGIAASVTTPWLFRLGGDARLAATLMPFGLIASIIGMLTFAPLQWLWASLAGYSLSGSMVTSLSLIGLRSTDPVIASRLSSMVQSVAYGGVAVGLVAAGVVSEVAGAGRQLLWYVLGLGVLLVLTAGVAGRNEPVA